MQAYTFLLSFPRAQPHLDMFASFFREFLSTTTRASFFEWRYHGDHGKSDTSFQFFESGTKYCADISQFIYLQFEIPCFSHADHTLVTFCSRIGNRTVVPGSNVHCHRGDRYTLQAGAFFYYEPRSKHEHIECIY